jgi:GDPmannose 4,6-dehydratase
MRRALIVGCDGQDGRILFDLLATRCSVLGIDVGTVRPHALDGVVPFASIDVRSAEHVYGLATRLMPHEIYYLAAHHHASEEKHDEAAELPKSIDVHILGLANFLEAIRKVNPSCRLFYAGSSQMFGHPAESPQNEATPFAPRNAYGITKVAGAHLCALYRERHGVHASVGILYNHESPLRAPRFVSQRIAQGARRAQRDTTYKLELSSLAAVVDWGYAPDYVDAMVRIVLEPQPDDYVIATGKGHTVRQFVELAFARLGLDWRRYVEEQTLVPGTSRPLLVGDATMLRERTGWRPSVTFEELVGILVDGITE